MVQKIRTSVIVVLTILNFIGFLSIMICASFSNQPKPYNKRKISSNNNYNNYSIEKDRLEFEMMNMKMNDKYNNKTNRKLLIHKHISSFYYESILILDLLFLYFCFNLVSSFIIGDNECNNCCDCCDCCCRGCQCGSADCNCNNYGGNGSELIACLIIIFIFVVIYYSTKLCGKHLARYISLSFICFINFSTFVISIIFISLVDKGEASVKINIVFSLILFLCNLLGMILPNINKLKNLRYKYAPHSLPQAINYPMGYQLPSTNTNIIVNQQYNSMQNNNYSVPIVNNEYNEFSHQKNNHSENNKSKTDSTNSSDQRILNNSGNMGIPPLPTDLPSSKEEYINSSIM